MFFPGANAEERDLTSTHSELHDQVLRRVGCGPRVRQPGFRSAFAAVSRRLKPWWRGLGLATVLLAAPLVARAADYILYAGSYTNGGGSKGIYAWRFDSSSGALSALGLMAPAEQPAYIWIARNGRYLYTVNWLVPGQVSAFAIDPQTARLTLLNSVSSGGDRPNQIVLDHQGRLAVTTNYSTGTFAAFAVLPDGRLSDPIYVDKHVGVPRSAMTGPLAHGAEFSKDDRFVYVTDLGLDRVYAYRMDAAQGKIAPGDPAFVTVAGGSGPRRLQLSPDGRFLYVNHETDSKVSVFAVDGAKLTEIQTASTLPEGVNVPNMTAEIVLDAAGKHLYVSNRGHGSIVVYDVDRATGRLSLVQSAPSGGKSPRNIRLDPTGGYLLSSNEDNGTITVLKVGKGTGRLSSTASVAAIDKPGGLYFLPTK